MHRLQIKFDEIETSALVSLAHAERRTLRQQIERIVRAELERRGLVRECCNGREEVPQYAHSET